MKRRITLAILIGAIAIGIIAISQLIAGGSGYDGNRNGMIDNAEAVKGIQDYFNGSLGQEEAVDLFLRYFASVPIDVQNASSTLTPSLAPTFVPTTPPTATPTPIFADFQLPCVNRTSGTLGGRYHPAQKIVGKARVQDMEAVFTNPAKGEWQYGFESAWTHDPRSNKYHGLRVVVDSNGNWLLYLYNHYQEGYIVWRGGNLRGHQIPFNYEAGEKNLVTLATNINEQRFQLLVNGVEVPLDFEDRMGEERGASYIKISDHAFLPTSQTRRQYIFGQAEDGIEYTDFCAHVDW